MGMTDMQQVHDEMVAEAPPEAPRKSSGYRRLQVRHRNLLAEHEVLKADLAERDQIESELHQAVVEGFAINHRNIGRFCRDQHRSTRPKVPDFPQLMLVTTRIPGRRNFSQFMM